MEYAAALRRQDDGGDLVDECRIPATLAPPPLQRFQGSCCRCFGPSTQRN